MKRQHVKAKCVLPVAWILMLTQPMAAHAVAHGRLMTPADVARLNVVLSAQIAPDGKQIAYIRAVPRAVLKDPDGGAWTELHVVDSQGQSRPFVTGQVNVGHVRWTPDGRQITFLAKRGDDKHQKLYAIPIDGGEARVLVEHDENISAFALSSDGQRVAFLAAEPLPKEQQDYREKGFNQEIYEEDYRPVRVWLARSDGSDKPLALALEGSAYDIDWSPDGQRLAVVLAPTPLVDDSFMFKRVHVVDADTGKMIQSVQNPGKLGTVRFSPDGKRLAMISARDLNDPHEGRLMVTQVPGDGSLRDLMPDYQAHVSALAWKDSGTIQWVADERVATTMGTVTLDGQRQVLISAQGPILSDLTLSRDGHTAAVVGHSSQFPQEVFLLGEGQQEAKRLTNTNPWLDELRLAEQTVVRWNARDGLQLEGILVKPINYQPGQRYPLIMTVHGGPEAHVANGWVTSYASPGHVGAARGFAVFYPNYRGSTGRGVEFSKMGQADAAGKEFDDIVDAIDHLVAEGLVDKQKVGITGGSYGGYASAWGATFYSDRYAASVMFVGLSDNVSKLGTTDIPEEMYLVHHRKRLWDDWDYFLNRSPIRYVTRNRTPTLILHGKVDPRVHPSQSLELYRHLKTLKQAPVRLVLYEGEGHGNRKAAARIDYNLRMLRWMEHYLQGPGGEPPEYTIDYTKALEGQ